MKIRVKHEPRKQIIIHELAIYETPQEMAETMTAGIPLGVFPATFRWVDGVVFLFTSLQSFGDVLVKETIEGNLHWDHVSVSSMPDYASSIRVNDLTIPVVNVSRNEVFRAVGPFLRKKIEDFNKKETPISKNIKVKHQKRTS